MGHYNRSHEIFDLEKGDMQYLNHGSCANVYYNQDIIFKEYFPKTPIGCRISEEMFDILKTIIHPCFLNLFDIYGDFRFSESIKQEVFQVNSYTGKYYQDDYVNVLEECKDYILDNFRQLEKLIEIFTDNGIAIYDVKRDNIILRRNGMVMIDPDFFYKADLEKSLIADINCQELLNLFKRILQYAVKDLSKNLNLELLFRLYEELTDIEVSKDLDFIYEISKKLRYVNKPIDSLYQ